MKRLLCLVLMLLSGFVRLSAGGLASGLAPEPKVEVAVAVDADTKPATTFSKDVPKLYAFFKSKGTAKGDELKSVWIAEDVGDAAPKNFKIDEATLSADKDDFFGAFSLSKPNNGWPVGKYRVDIYAGDKVVATAKFKIE